MVRSTSASFEYFSFCILQNKITIIVPRFRVVADYNGAEIVGKRSELQWKQIIKKVNSYFKNVQYC